MLPASNRCAPSFSVIRSAVIKRHDTGFLRQSVGRADVSIVSAAGPVKSNLVGEEWP